MSSAHLLEETVTPEVEQSLGSRPGVFKRLCTGLHQYALFGYFSPYMRLARYQGSGAVRPDALPDLWPSDNLLMWSNRFTSSASKTQQQPRASRWALLYTLYRAFSTQFSGILCIKIIATLLSLLSIVLMGRFLQWQEKSPTTVTTADRNKGLIAGLGILALELLNIICGAQCNFWAQRVGLRVQGVLAAGLFKRVIGAPDWRSRIDSVQIEPKSSAYNLLMIDVPSIAEFVFSLTDLIVLPIRVALSFELLRHEVGASAMAGLLCLVGVVTIIMGLEIQSGFLKAPYLRYRDARMSRCHDTLNNIRSLRMIGWEEVAADSVLDARQKEISYRTRRMYLDSFAASLSNAAYALTQIAIFMAYVIWGLQSDASFVFKASVAIPVMQVVGRLVGPLTNLPFIINSLIEGYISMERYEKYIFGSGSLSREQSATTISTEDDIDDTTPLTSSSDDGSLPTEHEYIDPNENLVLVRDAIFSWVQIPEMYDGESPLEERLLPEYLALGESGSTLMASSSGHGMTSSPQPQPHLFGDPSAFIPRPHPDEAVLPEYEGRFRLRIPTLKVKAGECVAVIGQPGSGKSSLLLALLGEIPQARGYLEVARSRRAIDGTRSMPYVGYVSQVPWIPGGTVRSVILFGRPYNVDRYRRVVNACELQPDFDSWPGGDAKVVSEGASNISAGQRARIALARALYDYPKAFGTGTKVFLLDDPFSSIDPRVGSNIFRNLLGPDGLIRNAAVVLTVDEVSLRFFLDSLNTSGVRLSVSLQTHIMERGLLSEMGGGAYPALPSAGPISRVTYQIDGDQLPWETEVVPPSSEQIETLIEQAYSGVVGKQTYWWYSRYVGFTVLFLMVAMIMTLHFTGTGADFWIAHWTAMVPEKTGTVTDVASHEPGIKSAKTQEKPTITSSGTQENILHRQSSFIQFRKSRVGAALQQPLQPDDDAMNSFMELNNPIAVHLLSAFPEKTANDEVNMSALAVFIMLSLASTAAVIVLYILDAFGSIRAAVKVHSKLLTRVVNAPFWLYDFLPIGVIINRFSADTEVVDGGPLFSISYFFGSCVHVLITVIALCALSPWCAPLIPVVAWAVYAMVYSLYRPTCREFQRSKLLALSPLCGNLSEAESGAVVIRALGANKFYNQVNLHLTTNLMKVQFMQIGSNNWATTRLQLLAFPFTIINSVVPVCLRLMGLSGGAGLIDYFFHEPKESQISGFVGLAISFALALPTAIGSVVWSISLLEQKMCSVQRVRELVSAEDASLEDRRISPESTQLHVTSMEALPQRTGVQLKNVEVSFQRLRDESLVLHIAGTEEAQRFARENLPPSLTGITIECRPGEHIGVIGRTGAGKSTLLLSLMNLVPTSRGAISIDGVPLTSFSKAVLKKIIGVLPQSPAVQKGWTVRRSLDPQGEFKEESLLAVLQSVGLGKTVAALPSGLDTVIIHDEFEEMRLTELLTVGAGEPLPSRQLSDTQLRLLSLARLALQASQYRLVLVDEPPPRQMTKAPPAKVSPRKRQMMAGEQGATQDVDESEEGSVVASEKDEEIEIANLFKTMFPMATVIIAAHHASTLQKCDTIWILSKGRLVAKCDASTVTSQESLMEVILSHETK